MLALRFLALCTLLFVPPAARAADPLESWHEGEARSAILDFVDTVTDPTSDNFVPADERVAVFDNDGTLWTEKPLYIHFFGIVERMSDQIEADPSLADREPWRTIATKDTAYLTQLYEAASYDTLAGSLFAVPFGGMTAEDYDAWADTFLAGFEHPTFGSGVDGLVYQPMVELIQHLEANGFTVWIFTADEGAFVRRVSERLYGIPPERVQGSSVRHEYTVENGQPVLRRTHALSHLNNWEGKPRLIRSAIGRTPIFAAGNSNGDRHMLQSTALSGGLSVLLHHTDDDRETAYDGHTDQVLPLASEDGWLVIDMARDWRRVWPE